MTEDLNSYSHLWPDEIVENSTKLEAARGAARAASIEPDVPDMAPIAHIQT